MYKNDDSTMTLSSNTAISSKNQNSEFQKMFLSRKKVKNREGTLLKTQINLRSTENGILAATMTKSWDFGLWQNRLPWLEFSLSRPPDGS